MHGRGVGGLSDVSNQGHCRGVGSDEQSGRG